MRKIKLQVQISVDGFIAGPSGEMDWMTWDWDDTIKDYTKTITTRVDCIILGRVLAEGFIPAWASTVASADADEFAHKMHETLKIVFSKTLQTIEGNNTRLASGNLVEEITALKNQPGNDIIAYGGANFVSNLIASGLIDEYHLYVNPVALGAGMPIFKNLPANMKLKLIKTTTGTSGITVLFYEPVKEQS